MKIATLYDLKAADDLLNLEAPPSFAYWKELRRVAGLRAPLSELTGLIFEQDTSVQDASFFTELSAMDTVSRFQPGVGQAIDVFAAVRFSAFGGFFTVWDNSSIRPLPEEVRQRIAEFVCQHGYVYAPDELLEQPYPDQERFRDWGYRYFEYL